MAESRAEKKKREEAEYEAECQRRDAEKAKSEAARVQRDLREHKNNAEEDRERAAQEIECRDEEIGQLELQVGELQSKLAFAEVTNNNLQASCEKLHDSVRTAWHAAKNGPTGNVERVLREALEFSTTFLTGGADAVTIAEIPPCEGRGLLEPEVSFTPTPKGLLVRVDDKAIAEFWMTVLISETSLLRFASMVHRLARPSLIASDDTIT